MSDPRTEALGQVAVRLAAGRADPASPEVKAAAERSLALAFAGAKDMKVRFAGRSLPKGLPEEALRLIQEKQAQSGRSTLVGCFVIHGVDKATAEKLVEQLD